MNHDPQSWIDDLRQTTADLARTRMASHAKENTVRRDSHSNRSPMRLIGWLGVATVALVSFATVAVGHGAIGAPEILRQALESKPVLDAELRYSQELEQYEEDLERYQEALDRYEKQMKRNNEARREHGDQFKPLDPPRPLEPSPPEPPEVRASYAPSLEGLSAVLSVVDRLHGPLTVLLTALVPLGVVAGGTLLALGINKGMQLVATSAGAGALVLLGQGIVL